MSRKAKSWVCALAAGLCSCALSRAVWRAPELPAQAQALRTTTSDGWELALVRYRPEAALPGRRPVLLLHGLVTNARCFDFDDRHSMARWLSSRGVEAWTVSLRGHGDSQQASLFSGPYRYDWDLDDYCTKDLPAALAAVRSASGAARVDLVAHSMGGMIAYCMLARGGEPASALGAVATLGSPVRFRWGPRFQALAQATAQVGANVPVLTLNSGALLSLPLLSMYTQPSALILFNAQNIDQELWSRFLTVGVDDESPALVRQFRRFLDSDRFVSRDGSVDYEALLAGVRTPVLVVAGKVDQLGAPPLVRPAHEALGGEKAWHLVAEENGASADYGHMDLLLGDRAAEDVFTPVEQWLASRAGTSTLEAPGLPPAR